MPSFRTSHPPRAISRPRRGRVLTAGAMAVALVALGTGASLADPASPADEPGGGVESAADDPLALIRAADGSIDWWVGLSQEQRDVVYDAALPADPPDLPIERFAMAAPAPMGRIGPGVEVSGVTSSGTVWLGAVEGAAQASLESWLSWCITAGYDAPAGTTATSIDPVGDAPLANVVRLHEGDNTQLSRAAIGFLAHTRHETGTATVSAAARIASFMSRTPQAVKDQAAAFLAEAAAAAGPYDQAAPATVEGSGTRTGVIHVHPVVGPAGQPLVGLEQPVTLHGPAVFDTNGNQVADPDETATVMTLTAAETLNLSWVAVPGGNGPVTWSFSVRNLPRSTMSKLSASGQVQATLTYGLRFPSDPEELVLDGPSFDAVDDFRVVPRSQVVEGFTAPGGVALDEVWVDLVEGDTWTEVDGALVPVAGTVTAYAAGAGDPLVSAVAPAGAAVLGSADFTVTGPGRVNSTQVGVPVGDYDGRVTFVVTVTRAQQSHPNLREDARHDYGLVEETTVVPSRLGGTSRVQVKVSDPQAATLTDTFVAHPVEGDVWPAGPDGVTPVEAPYRWTALTVGQGVPTTSPQNPTDATVLGTGVVTATHDGAELTATIPNPWLGVASGGSVVFVWEFAEADGLAEMLPYQVTGWRDDFAVPDETLYVPFTPDVASNASVRETRNGSYFVDELFVGSFPTDHGQFGGGLGFAGDVAEMSQSMFWFPQGVDVTDENLDAAELVAQVTVPAVNGYFASVGSTEFLIPGTAPGEECTPGTAAFQTAFVGDDRAVGVTSSVADPTEQYVVECPALPLPRDVQVTTEAQSSQAVPVFGDGGTLSDAHVVDGLVLAGDRGWSTLSCDLDYDGQYTGDEVLWQSDSVLYPQGAADGTVVAMPGGFAYGDLIDEALWLQELTCSFGQTTVDAAGLVLAQEAPGKPAQTLTVQPAPRVTTTAHASSPDPVVSDEIWDVMDWSGTFPGGSSTIADLYYVGPREELTCTDETRIWASEPVTIDTSPGQGTTNRYRTTKPGTYGFVETTTGPDGEVITTGECGDAAETLTVSAAADQSAWGSQWSASGSLATTGQGVAAGLIGLSLVLAGVGVVVWRRQHANDAAIADSSSSED